MKMLNHVHSDPDSTQHKKWAVKTPTGQNHCNLLEVQSRDKEIKNSGKRQGSGDQNCHFPSAT